MTTDYSALIPAAVASGVCVLGTVAYLIRQYLANLEYYRIPLVQGGLPFFGVVFEMVKGSPWDSLAKWARKYGTVSASTH